MHGCLYGSCNPRSDVHLLMDLYRSGVLKLDELISRRYRLDQILEGYRDLLGEQTIRGVVVHDS